MFKSWIHWIGVHILVDTCTLNNKSHLTCLFFLKKTLVRFGQLEVRIKKPKVRYIETKPQDISCWSKGMKEINIHIQQGHLTTHFLISFWYISLQNHPCIKLLVQMFSIICINFTFFFQQLIIITHDIGCKFLSNCCRF